MLMPQPQFHRVIETKQPRVTIFIDDVPHSACAGDTLLTALLTAGRRVRISEFGDGPRAGFCIMGGCQDCWVDLSDGRRVRACTTFVSDGLRVITTLGGHDG